MKVKINSELIIINAISLLAVLMVFLDRTGLFRLLIGVPFALFLPGYTLVALLYPGREDIRVATRVALSLGLSIAVVPLAGLILVHTSRGLNNYSVVLAISLIILVLSLCGWLRRRRLTEENRFQICFSPEGKAAPIAGLQAAIGVMAVVVSIFSVGLVAYVIEMPKAGESYTEFYMLGPDGKAGSYPVRIESGGVGAVTLGIVNNEFRDMEYRVEVLCEGGTSVAAGSVALGHGERYETAVPFKVSTSEGKARVDLLLFRKGETDPYRTLRLWVEVGSAAPGTGRL